ncbi:RICIN domain-containing protein [Streptomyces lydicus]|uniref:RICIN domain-containing protein n=1 Tax=Streptomyces lydicus TaxID=47763 RepID=UPI0036A4BB34
MKKIHVVVSASCLSVLLGVALMPSASAKDPERTVTIHGAAVDSVLDAIPVPGGGQSQLRQTKPAGTASQQWVVTDTGGGWSQIRNARSGDCLHGSGNYVLLMKCASTDPAQRWKTLPANAGTVMLTSEGAAKGTVVRGNTTIPNLVGYLSEPQGDGAQFRWTLENVSS